MLKPLHFLALLLLRTTVLYGDGYTSTILYPLTVPGGASTDLRQVTAGGTVGYSPLSGSVTPSHALLWSPADGTLTDLNPTGLGATDSEAFGEFGNQQVGLFGGGTAGSYSHAVLWSDTAASAIDLNPAQLGALDSYARATDGVHQVGRGTFGPVNDYTFHALLWTGTAASAVDLNPTNLGTNVDSFAFGVHGSQEVGAYESATQPIHAVLWTGTAGSAVDLHPLDPTLEFSDAYATSGNQQVGVARANGGNSEAFLWYGTAASAVNLNPTILAGINSSIADATNGVLQVGYGFDGSASVNDDQALVWSGSSNSVADLHSVLPRSGIWNFSEAYSVDSQGNVFGTANGTFNGVTGTFAVEWSGVPEPGSGIFLAAAANFLFLRRGKQKRI
jgi:hypothetical protein